MIIFSLPLIVILVERKNFKQNPDQCPINFPPKRTNLCGSKRDGIKIIEIKIIPVKKKNENKIFLVIVIKRYIKSLRFCLLLIT